MAVAKEKKFKLPRFVRLNRGAMWFDIDGENSSGIKLYAVDTVFVGRGEKEGELDIPKDKFNNQNFVNYGFIDADDKIQWYADTKDVPTEKLSRVILAYKHGILVEADPDSPPRKIQRENQNKEFAYNNKGERVFVGNNKEMYKKLQNLPFDELRKFILACPKNETTKNNLIDMYHYEQRGYNRLSRARLEVLDLIRSKLNEYGPSMSPIRVNED